MKKNYNPQFNETFSFPISVTDVVSKTVVMQVIDKDMITKDDPVGEVQIPLWEMDLYGMNDTWSELGAVTGTANKPVLKRHHQPPPPQQTYLLQQTSLNGRERKSSTSSVSSKSSSSSSSSDEEIRTSNNLTLKQLNNLLLQYIDQVRDMDTRMDGGLNMSIDRSEIDALHSQYETILRDWRNKYERSEHDLAEARGHQATVGDLQREVAHLRAELDNANKARNHEQARAADIEARMRATEMELRNRITILETELNNEKSRGTIDMSSVDSRMKGEYEAMLKKELKNLRKLYKANMKHSQEEFMRTYNQKLADLERALAHERSTNSSAAVEAKELRIRVEDLRRRVNELESNNQVLGHKASELQINLQDQAASYESKVTSILVSFLLLKFNTFISFSWLAKTKRLHS